MRLIDIKGIGEKSKTALESKGVFSCEDLAKFLPSKFYNITKPEAFVSNKKAIVVEVELLEDPSTHFAKRIAITRAKAQDVSGRVIGLVWFNQRYAKNAYKKGNRYIVYGNSRANEVVVVSMKPASQKQEFLGMFPVYKKTGISRKVLQSAIFECQTLFPITSIISDRLHQKFGLLPLADAYKVVHVAKSEQELQSALERIELEKATNYLLGEGRLVGQKRKVREKLSNLDYSAFQNLLPFKLTGGQQSALSDILADFASPISANRLIQGEVGSGKTLVALIAALVCVQNGYQVAFLAPTEILARQHFQTFNKYFSSVATSVLVTSSDPNRKQAEEDVKEGKAKVVFGTHVLALSTQFFRLGLVIIDEQQRFGVELRAALVQKSQTKDTISLTATPIPRSVLLSLSGVLSSSQIAERPNANHVATHFVGKSKEAQMWEFLKSQEKVFVVCPRIEEMDDPFEDDVKISSVKAEEKKLKEIFGQDLVVRVDGSMKPENQKNVMQQFATGPQKVLVATTVIEVGVDVPSASAMVIRGADKYGLSTLHQLRGRVGRNGKEAHCFVMLDKKPQDQTLERLNFFKEHNNGFEIAEFDYSSRGAGDALGTRQSGENVVPFSAKTLQKAREVVDCMGVQKQVLVSNN